MSKYLGPRLQKELKTNTKKIKSSNKKSNLVTGAIGGFVAGKLSNNKKASAKKADSNNEEIEIKDKGKFSILKITSS